LDFGLFLDSGRFFIRVFNDTRSVGARLSQLVLLLFISDPRDRK
jgi:predicted nucleic acid-binding OB-fold protein